MRDCAFQMAGGPFHHVASLKFKLSITKHSTASSLKLRCSGDKHSLGHRLALVTPVAMGFAVFVFAMVVLTMMSMPVTVTVVMTMAHRIVECYRLRQLLVGKVGKTSVLKHLLNLILCEAVVCDTTLCSILGVYLVGDKIDDEEHASEPETLSQSLGCQIRFVEVVKPESHTCDIEVKELGVCKGRR